MIDSLRRLFSHVYEVWQTGPPWNAVPETFAFVQSVVV